MATVIVKIGVSSIRRYNPLNNCLRHVSIKQVREYACKSPKMLVAVGSVPRPYVPVGVSKLSVFVGIEAPQTNEYTHKTTSIQNDLLACRLTWLCFPPELGICVRGRRS
jgi:hypothetical protein